jgi:hypothetical protein
VVPSLTRLPFSSLAGGTDGEAGRVTTAVAPWPEAGATPEPPSDMPIP